MTYRRQDFPGDEPRNIAQAAHGYFLACTDEVAIDILEMCFQLSSRLSYGGAPQVNEIFREEGIGYEFTEYREIVVEIYGNGCERKVPQFPQATKKTDEFTHKEVVMPCLQVLALPVWQTANAHLMDAHESYRNGKFRQCVVDCSSALETVLKTICKEKGWAYTPNKDTLSDLVKVCNDNGFIYPFYSEILKNLGTMRNKLGAHGNEPKPEFAATELDAAHMIHLSSAHILYLVRRVNL